MERVLMRLDVVAYYYGEKTVTKKTQFDRKSKHSMSVQVPGSGTCSSAGWFEGTSFALHLFAKLLMKTLENKEPEKT